MADLCDSQFCENDAETIVPVSVASYGDQTRNLCTSCEEMYSIGAQHGTYRSTFKIAEALTDLIGSVTLVPGLDMFSEADDVLDQMEEEEV